MVESYPKLSRFDDTEEFLKAEQVNYHIQSHDAVMTANELPNIVKCNNPDLKFDYTKNLVFKSKGDKFVFYLIKADVKADLKTLEAYTKEKGIRAADDSHLIDLLNVQKGSVNPLALLNLLPNNTDKFVVVVDSSLTSEYICIHPMVNTHSIWLKREDLLNLLAKKKIQYTVLDVQAFVEKAKADKAKLEKEKETKEKEGKEKKDDDHELNIQNDKIKNFPDWYSEVIIKSEMIDYYDISGCYILRPWAYSIWEQIQGFFDKKIKNIGVQNSYFPMFVSQDVLEKEKEHVEGFSPEVAWVTHYGDKQLEKKIAIRPTSETIMYPLFAKWIRSHRDLPLLLNQWCNVVRWEFKHPTPFIRTREFLWQEGHTAHESQEDAENFMLKILDFYKDVYENLLAIPVIQGFKSENEKFAGASKTSTIETIITENGKAIQCATSHSLGQNFSKMFDINYLDKKQQMQSVWQTSWGLTTRSIGVLIMTHGDNKGLILPPRVAPIQIILVAILTTKDKTTEIPDTLKQIYQTLIDNGIRAKIDDGDSHTPGFKYNFWERKGVPLRIEFGRKDLEKGQVTFACRDTFERLAIPISEVAAKAIETLELIQCRLLQNATNKLVNCRKEAKDFTTFHKYLNEKAAILTPWCTDPKCEDEVKQKVKDMTSEEENNAGTCKTLCLPFVQEQLSSEDICFNCGKKAIKHALWGRSY